MDDEYDVLEIDLPDYEEEYPPLPEPETDMPFSENKEEVYQRNRLIAAERQYLELKTKEKDAAYLMPEPDKSPAVTDYLRALFGELGASFKEIEEIIRKTYRRMDRYGYLLAAIAAIIAGFTIYFFIVSFFG